MKILKLTRNNTNEILKRTLKILKTGGLVVFPSDTVYGLLVDASSDKAVNKLIEFKNRPPGKAISVFVDGFEMIKRIARLSKEQFLSLSRMLPGAYTVVLDSKHKLSLRLESEKGTLGLRYIKYKLVTDLVGKLAAPLTATSANLAGNSPHYSIESFLKSLSKKKRDLIDLIIDAGDLPHNKPSTVIDFTQPDVKILRRGDLTVAKRVQYRSKSAENTKDIGKLIYKKTIIDVNKPTVFIIQGELGVGKTMLIKGIGESLNINNIVSPTYVIYYEYGNFYHFDLYQIEDKDEFKFLGIEKLLKPGKILCFEWGEKIAEIYELIKKRSKIVYIDMKYIDEQNRLIEVSD